MFQQASGIPYFLVFDDFFQAQETIPAFMSIAVRFATLVSRFHLQCRIADHRRPQTATAVSEELLYCFFLVSPKSTR
jgi:hypothetical protein